MEGTKPGVLIMGDKRDYHFLDTSQEKVAHGFDQPHAGASLYPQKFIDSLVMPGSIPALAVRNYGSTIPIEYQTSASDLPHATLAFFREVEAHRDRHNAQLAIVDHFSFETRRSTAIVSGLVQLANFEED